MRQAREHRIGPLLEQRTQPGIRLWHLTVEREVVPTFYDRDASGIPRRWLAYVRRAIVSVAPRFSARRMVKQYAEDLYSTAAERKAQV